MPWTETARLASGPDRIECFVARPAAPSPGGPALLIVHGHQFPERPGGRHALPEGALDRFTTQGWTVAAPSQPGYGESTGPPDMCGPRTQAAIRAAFTRLLAGSADPARSVVWGISRGAMAAACAFQKPLEPALLILQAGTYDLSAWVAWVAAGAPGGDPDTARAILANQCREMGDAPAALAARSGLRFASRGSCDVLLVHGGADPQAPRGDLEAMRTALADAGRRTALAVEDGAGHRLSGGFALRAARTFRPDLGLPAPGREPRHPSPR
ncbi:MAG: prolyl oligopeptidase family serine peptidase [Pseudomonadota bacterium]